MDVCRTQRAVEVLDADPPSSPAHVLHIVCTLARTPRPYLESKAIQLPSALLSRMKSSGPTAAHAKLVIMVVGMIILIFCYFLIFLISSFIYFKS